MIHYHYQSTAFRQRTRIIELSLAPFRNVDIFGFEGAQLPQAQLSMFGSAKRQIAIGHLPEAHPDRAMADPDLVRTGRDLTTADPDLARTDPDLARTENDLAMADHGSRMARSVGEICRRY